VFASFEQTPQSDHRRALRTYYAEKLEVAMGEEERSNADAWIREHFGFIVPGEDDEVTLTWLLETAAQAVLRKEAQIMVVDPWNELDHLRPPEMSQTEYVGFAIKQLKRFARKYRVHMIIAAHPAKMMRGKDGKYPAPSLYDISDSAHWSNKPDVGIVIHREKITETKTQIRIVKVRYSTIGRPGELVGFWDVGRTRYTIGEDEAA
jgi:twinkle protein